MKFIKLILFSVAAFFIMASAVAFFIPAHVQVLRMVYLPLSNDTVLNRVKDLAQWKTWYPGFDRIELKNTVSANERVVKATANGVTLQVKQASDSVVIVEMQKGDRPVTATWQINKDNRNDSLALQNVMETHLKWYPWEKFSSLLLDKSYGDRMLLGLHNLKEQ
ncbi:MAG: hypothetical protein QM640_04240 [Niabella sp.]